MENIKKGDILVGEKRDKGDGAYHPVVYICGDTNDPIALVMTHTPTEVEPCNVRMNDIYDKRSSDPQYFITHPIYKLPKWGPYRKIDELTVEDLLVIEKFILNEDPITWEEYLEYTKNGCPEHEKSTAQRPSK